MCACMSQTYKNEIERWHGEYADDINENKYEKYHSNNNNRVMLALQISNIIQWIRHRDARVRACVYVNLCLSERRWSLAGSHSHKIMKGTSTKLFRNKINYHFSKLAYVFRSAIGNPTSVCVLFTIQLLSELSMPLIDMMLLSLDDVDCERNAA